MHDETRWTLDDVITLFDGVFAERYRTRLTPGGDEPLYQPASGDADYHQVIFAHGFYASALHEISHWCIAGERRRQLEDYGYWYLPDGRDAQQQNAFEAAELAPQALELLFCEASERPFHVSVDNLGGEVEVDRKNFTDKVLSRAQRYRDEGLPRRAAAFQVTLQDYYQKKTTLDQACRAGQALLDQSVSSPVSR